MAYIPKGAQWYIADVVIEFTVEGDSRNVVHVNTLLVRADAPEEAYEKAIELGQAEIGEPYLNSEGRRVVAKFIGLRDLNVVHSALGHGAELYFEERVGIDASDLAEIVQEKSRLSVFCEIESRTDLPDYGCGQITRDYELARQNPGTRS